jgi:hypothetical protein
MKTLIFLLLSNMAFAQSLCEQTSNKYNTLREKEFPNFIKRVQNEKKECRNKADNMKLTKKENSAFKKFCESTATLALAAHGTLDGITRQQINKSCGLPFDDWQKTYEAVSIPCSSTLGKNTEYLMDIKIFQTAIGICGTLKKLKVAIDLGGQ